MGCDECPAHCARERDAGGPVQESKDPKETHQMSLELNARWRPPEPLEAFVPLRSSKGSLLQFRFNWRGGKL
jgi:hypothetical protein